MTAPRDELAALLARVEAATGADREIGVDLMRLLSPPPTGQAYVADHDFVEIEGDDWIILTGGDGEVECVPNPAASVDAALALVERKLPLARVYIAREPDSYSRAEIVEGRNHSTRLLGDTARTDSEVALCVITALLTALLQSEAGQGDGAGENLVHHHG